MFGIKNTQHNRQEEEEEDEDEGEEGGGRRRGWGEEEEVTLSWISSLMVGFLLVERGTLSQLTSGLMVRP